MSAPAREARSVRVLDFGPLVAAYATRLMAEAGAEVLRVDPPPAQPGLSLPPVAEYFHAGKHGITLAPDHPAGRQILARLLARSDMVVLGGENAVVQRACEDYSHLVVVSMAGIEPDLDLASAELMLCATSGVLSIAGDPDGPPRLPGGHAALAAAGLQVAAAAYAALVWQRQAGRGQRVTVNLREALQHLLDRCCCAGPCGASGHAERATAAGPRPSRAHSRVATASCRSASMPPQRPGSDCWQCCAPRAWTGSWRIPHCGRSTPAGSTARASGRSSSAGHVSGPATSSSPPCTNTSSWPPPCFPSRICARMFNC